MVERGAEIEAVFHALSDPTRRAVVERLRDAPQSVSALAAAHPISLAAFVKHLAVLENAGLITSTKTGRTRWCTLVGGALRPATQWLRDYEDLWNTSIDALEAHLEKNP